MIPKPWQEETNAWVLSLLVPSGLFEYENKFKFFFSFSQSSKLMLLYVFTANNTFTRQNVGGGGRKRILIVLH